MNLLNDDPLVIKDAIKKDRLPSVKGKKIGPVKRDTSTVTSTRKINREPSVVIKTASDEIVLSKVIVVSE